MELGLKLTKVHRVLESDQYLINFNAQKRKAGINSFEKYFFKLMNNSVFGNTMEDIDIRKQVDVRLMSDNKKLLKMTSKPT